jgi:hypothetical protein
LSCAAEYTALPQRLAGTASQYSKNAMPQLEMITSGSETSLNLRCPYQAKVMKMLEANNIKIGRMEGEMVGIAVLLQCARLTGARGTRQLRIASDFKEAKVSAWSNRGGDLRPRSRLRANRARLILFDHADT